MIRLGTDDAFFCGGDSGRAFHMWWKKSCRSQPVRAKLTAFIDEGSELEGKCTFSGTVMLNGRFRGEIVSVDTLIIGERGVVNATIRAGTVLVNGELTGSVEATERVELRRGARVFGDLGTPQIVVEEGVLFEGHCRTTRAKAPEAVRDFSVVTLKR